MKNHLGKTLIFTTLRLGLIILIVELFSFGMLYMIDGTCVSLSALNEQKAAVIAFKEDPFELVNRDTGVRNHGFLEGLNVHPFFGFSTNKEFLYQQVDSRLPALQSWMMRSDGRPDKSMENHPGIGKVDTFTIGITGGSVAGQFWDMGTPALSEELQKCPKLNGRKITYVCLAIHGYKQPQQLMVLSYFLALGGHLDVLINLDGFNEITLPVSENALKNVNPFYPRSWYFLSQGMTDRTTLSAAGRMMEVLDNCKTLARVTSRVPFRWSYAAGLVWQLQSRRSGEAIIRIQNELTGASFSDSAGAIENLSSIYGDIGDDLEQVWKNCSVQLNLLCNGNGIRYFHFLQPNQYVPGSKIFSPEELQTAYNSHVFKELVQAGYPGLTTKGMELVDEGVMFVDMSMLFEQTEETIYSDACCHLNEMGNQMLGHAVGKAIADDFCK